MALFSTRDVGRHHLRLSSGSTILHEPGSGRVAAEGCRKRARPQDNPQVPNDRARKKVSRETEKEEAERTVDDSLVWILDSIFGWTFSARTSVFPMCAGHRSKDPEADKVRE